MICGIFPRFCVLSFRACFFYYFFFQAEDGIRDVAVTGVQTCALPIWRPSRHRPRRARHRLHRRGRARDHGRAARRAAGAGQLLDVRRARPRSRRAGARVRDPAGQAHGRGPVRRVHRLQPGRAAARGGEGPRRHAPARRDVPGHHRRPPRSHAAVDHSHGGEPLSRRARHGAVGPRRARAGPVHLLRLDRAAPHRPGEERDHGRLRRRPLHEARGGGRPRRRRLRRPPGHLGDCHPLPARPRHHRRHARAWLGPRSVVKGRRLHLEMGRRRHRQAVARRLYSPPPRAARGVGAPAAGGLPALSVAALLQASARAHAHRVALEWDGGALGYAELDARAGALACALDARGVRAGDRVAVVIPNRWQFVVAVLGALQVGATVAPLDPLLTGEERAAIIADLSPRLVVDDAPAEAGTWTLAEPRGPALVLYTSGSTGRPKGAVLSHAALAFALRSWAEPVMALTRNDIVLAALPLSHSYGLNGALLAPLLVGATVRLVERFTADGVADLLARGSATVFPGVATMFRRLLDLDGFQGGPRLRVALSGAAPCPWELAAEFRARSGVRILRGYGMTELFRPISFLRAVAEARPDAVAAPVPGVAAGVVDVAGDVAPAVDA